MGQVWIDEAADLTQDQIDFVLDWKDQVAFRQVAKFMPVFIITLMAELLSTSARGSLGIAMRINA